MKAKVVPAASDPVGDAVTSIGERLLAALPFLLVISHELFLLILFFYQVQGYAICKEGVSCFRARVIAAGIFGMLVTVAPAILCILPGPRECLSTLFERSILCDEDGCMAKLYKLTLLILQVTFFVLFLVFAVLPIESSASLVGIATEIRFRTDCMGGHLLDVTENLTYSLESGWTTKAQRVLYNQAEPTQFRAQWVGGNAMVNVESVDRKEPKKFNMNYESGQLTTVNLNFGQHHAITNGTSFVVQLRYTARPYGDEDESERWWDVPNKVVGGDEVEQISVIIQGCGAANCSNHAGWAVTTGAAAKIDEGWQLKFSPPSSLAIGSDSCPLAWTLGSRNVWWVLTAVCFAIAAMICFCLAQGGSGDAAKPGLCLICFFLVSGMVFFMFAMMSDFWASDRDE